MQTNWEHDGVGLGGQYLETGTEGFCAGVHDYGSFAECSIWTPGCGFSPTKTAHETVDEAKAYAEGRLGLLSGRA
ncbi:MAG: hypothetical protein J0M00_13205 [Burkholderiales bacterium]|nr:hypothetical protein [Burkholderiales bacterium]